MNERDVVPKVGMEDTTFWEAIKVPAQPDLDLKAAMRHDGPAWTALARLAACVRPRMAMVGRMCGRRRVGDGGSEMSDF